MTKRVLLIKMTSMGDLMHALPALTDAANAIPGISFDWVADEAFAEIPHWHPAVNTVIKSAHRRWKKQIIRSFNNGELTRFYGELNFSDYDVIIDSQSNLKSAAVALLRRIGKSSGEIHGLDKSSVREKPAHWVYQQRHTATRNDHSIAQQRKLMAKALNYTLPSTEPDFGIERKHFHLPDSTTVKLPQRYLFFVHNASWTTKMWPEKHWLKLIERATNAGFSVLLPCGNAEEKSTAERLAAPFQQAFALPRLSLSEIARIMDKAVAAVCCDTGLGHLAGLLNLPAISFYGPTDAQLIGTKGENQQHIIASNNDYGCSPCYKKSCQFENSDTSACMESFQPETVWKNLQSILDIRILN